MKTVGIGNLVVSVDLLRCARYAVRPDGQLGTCGFYPYPWDIIVVRAV